MLKVAQEQLVKVEMRIAEIKVEIAKLESKSGGSTGNVPSKYSERIAELKHELSKLMDVATELRAHIQRCSAMIRRNAGNR